MVCTIQTLYQRCARLRPIEKPNWFLSQKRVAENGWLLGVRFLSPLADDFLLGADNARRHPSLHPTTSSNGIHRPSPIHTVMTVHSVRGEPYSLLCKIMVTLHFPGGHGTVQKSFLGGGLQLQITNAFPMVKCNLCRLETGYPFHGAIQILTSPLEQ